MSSAGKGDRTRTWTSPELRERWEETFGPDVPGGEECPSCGRETGVEVTEVQEAVRQLLCVSCGHGWSEGGTQPRHESLTDGARSG